LKFHHVGILVESIEQYFDDHFANELGIYSLDGPVFDTNQQAHTAMIRTGSGAGIELVSPAIPESPIYAALQDGGGLHHICYEVQNIEDSLADMRAAGMLPVSAPSPAALFDGLRVAFMYSKHGGLVELVEAPREDGSV